MASDSTSGRVFACMVCEWQYREDEGMPEEGHPPGTSFDELPESFECPECCAVKHWFREQAG